MYTHYRKIYKNTYNITVLPQWIQNISYFLLKKHRPTWQKRYNKNKKIENNETSIAVNLLVFPTFPSQLSRILRRKSRNGRHVAQIRPTILPGQVLHLKIGARFSVEKLFADKKQNTHRYKTNTFLATSCRIYKKQAHKLISLL